MEDFEPFSPNTVMVKKSLRHPFNQQINMLSFRFPLTQVACFCDGMVLPVVSKANERLGYEHQRKSKALSIRFNRVL